MEYILPGLMTVVVLLFIFRRQIRRAARGEPLWLKQTSRKELEEIVAEHKRRKTEEPKE
jgi:hypothetical protein